MTYIKPFKRFCLFRYSEGVSDLESKLKRMKTFNKTLQTFEEIANQIIQRDRYEVIDKIQK